jgi:hypothetical protein
MNSKTIVFDLEKEVYQTRLTLCSFHDTRQSGDLRPTDSTQGNAEETQDLVGVWSGPLGFWWNEEWTGDFELNCGSLVTREERMFNEVGREHPTLLCKTSMQSNRKVDCC